MKCQHHTFNSSQSTYVLLVIHSFHTWLQLVSKINAAFAGKLRIKKFLLSWYMLVQSPGLP